MAIAALKITLTEPKRFDHHFPVNNLNTTTNFTVINIMSNLTKALESLHIAYAACNAPLPDDLTGKKRKKARSKRNARYNAARAVVDEILDNVDISSATDLEKQLLTERQAAYNRFVEKTEIARRVEETKRLESIKFQREYRREQRKADSPYKDTLKQAARVARSLGFSVKASKHKGLISSYYIEPKSPEAITKYGDGYKMRLSDHNLPINHKRDSGFPGKELIIDTEATNEELKNAIEGIWCDILESGNLSEITQ